MDQYKCFMAYTVIIHIKVAEVKRRYIDLIKNNPYDG